MMEHFVTSTAKLKRASLCRLELYQTLQFTAVASLNKAKLLYKNYSNKLGPNYSQNLAIIEYQNDEIVYHMQSAQT